MILNAYVIYDNKALTYFHPFYAVNNAAAMRSFSDLANDPQTNIGRHPSDFSLLCCGVFNDNTGELVGSMPLAHVADATSLVKQASIMPLFQKREAS